MAIASESCGIEQIGEMAGAIWRVLAEKGPTSTAKLVKEVEAPRDLVMQALGWLARPAHAGLGRSIRVPGRDQ
ncbi:MAG: winged helix-turn-helix domain-containing protein, partial [Pirellulales bacterium]